MANKLASTDQYKLSPDGFSRFYLMSKLLRELYDKKNANLLDVGGSSQYMSQQLAHDGFAAKLTVIDILPKPEGMGDVAYVVGDATAMNFADNQYDTVISTDVLEHIPSDRKQAFVAECIRVAKDYVILAAPFDTAGVTAAEKATNELNQNLFGVEQEWLKEHFLYGKPELQTIQSYVIKAGYSCAVVGTNNLYTWLAATHINLIDAKIGLNSKAHAAINLKYNQSIDKGNEFDGPSYRHFIVIDKRRNLPADFIQKFKKTTDDSNSKDAAIEYLHELLELVATRLSEQRQAIDGHASGLVDAQRLLESSQIEQENLKAKISLQAKIIQDQTELVRRSRHYLKFYNSQLGKAARKAKLRLGR